MPVPNGELFDGLPIYENDGTLSALVPSDGTAPGSSKLIAGLGNDIDVVVSLVNPSNAPVQMYWSENVLPFKWAALGAEVTDSQQTPMRLRDGMVYRFESTGTDAQAFIDVGPTSIEYDDTTDQGFTA